MSQATRCIALYLHDFRFCATRDGLSRQEIAVELLELRSKGRDFARQVLQNHYRESLRLASL